MTYFHFLDILIYYWFAWSIWFSGFAWSTWFSGFIQFSWITWIRILSRNTKGLPFNNWFLQNPIKVAKPHHSQAAGLGRWFSLATRTFRYSVFMFWGEGFAKWGSTESTDQASCLAVMRFGDYNSNGPSCTQQLEVFEIWTSDSEGW